MPDMGNKICSVTFLPDGEVRSIYHDEIFGDLDGMEIERVTDVEFDNELQEWFARLIKTGEIIARGKSRDEVLKDEVRIVSERIFSGEQLNKNKHETAK